MPPQPQRIPQPGEPDFDPKRWIFGYLQAHAQAVAQLVELQARQVELLEELLERTGSPRLKARQIVRRRPGPDPKQEQLAGLLWEWLLGQGGK